MIVLTCFTHISVCSTAMTGGFMGGRKPQRPNGPTGKGAPWGEKMSQPLCKGLEALEAAIFHDVVHVFCNIVPIICNIYHMM